MGSYAALALRLYRNWTSIAWVHEETGHALHICRNWTSTKLEKWKSIAHAQKLEGIAHMLKLDKYIAHVPETRHVLHLCRNWTHTAHVCSPNSLCSCLSGQHQCGTLRFPVWATVEKLSGDKVFCTPARQFHCV